MAGKFDVLWFTIPSLYGHIPPRQDMAERRGGLGTFWAHPARVTAKNLTGLAGLEPTTYGLGNRRSIRLSYSPIPAIPQDVRVGIMECESRRGDRDQRLSHLPGGG